MYKPGLMLLPLPELVAKIGKFIPNKHGIINKNRGMPFSRHAYNPIVYK